MARPRSTDAQARILAATRDALERSPVSELCVEEIAARAKVGKQTIYKWWGSKGALAMEAALSNVEAQVPVEDTGVLRRDLLLFLERSGRHLRGTSTGRTLAALMAQAQGDAAFAKEFCQRFLLVRRLALRGLLEGAARRGELPKGTDLELLIDVLFGAYWYRLLTRRAPLDDRFARQLVALVLPKGEA